MKKHFSQIFVLLFVFFLTSCAPKIPFTQSIREKYKLTETDLKSIQFYVSDAIVLKRGEDLGREKGTDEGTLVIKSGRNEEHIVFKRNTSCVVNSVVDNNKLTMGFTDNPKEFLVFGSEDDKYGNYALKALECVNNKCKINYGDQIYYTSPGNQGIILLFKMQSLRKFHVEEKVVKGKKVK